MTETRASATMNLVNEAMASLRMTLDHHDQDIQEIQKIQGIHTRKLNEMNQNIHTILQKLNSTEVNSHTPQRNTSQNQNFVLTLARPVKLEFPHFSCDDPSSWVYKANQYFGYYQTPIIEKLLIASFHMDLEALIWF